ncbi:AIM24 family protein [Nocardiopsis kunsanensis]|uniref:AIM24 family protein n=1 Tax=Nocardiopsis kunsanensis TaxID=141693 RepID=UPI000344D64C|nr:AIM24 family protein [Nocardiopsis kunsanensis]
MRSQLFEKAQESAYRGMHLQNRKMLKVGLEGEFLARQGSMVAYQGDVDFSYQGSGSVGRFFKKALTGEGLPLMRVSGRGDVFLAHEAWDVHLIDLENESLTVNGANVLAFESGLDWDIGQVKGAGMVAGGLFNTVFTGSGRVAVVCHGSPVLLNVDQPTFVDTQAVVAWSSTLSTSVRSTFKAGAIIGRGSGEAFQLALEGQGFVLVQASEGVQAAQQQS